MMKKIRKVEKIQLTISRLKKSLRVLVVQKNQWIMEDLASSNRTKTIRKDDSLLQLEPMFLITMGTLLRV
jgi:hypothetical protein